MMDERCVWGEAAGRKTSLEALAVILKGNYVT